MGKAKLWQVNAGLTAINGLLYLVSPGILQMVCCVAAAVATVIAYMMEKSSG